MAERADTDTQLAKSVQQGNKQAFDLLVIKYQPKVLSIIRRYVGGSDEAQDIAQEAFLKAYLALPNFRGDSAFYTWLYRIVINSAKNHIIKRKKTVNTVDMEIQDAENIAPLNHSRHFNLPEAELSREQLEQAIAKAMSQLPEDLRIAITLREIDGLSYQEIAEVTNCPIGTVRSRIFRARDIIYGFIRPVLEDGTSL